jgi:two-component system chemotaxis response regulator CheB
VTGAQPPAGVIVVGTSAGGVEALREFVAQLPTDLPAAVAVVLHIPARAPSALATILDRAGPLPAEMARAGMPVRAGVVVTAPSDHHLLVGPTQVALSRGPRENGHRPSVDVLFRSAARWWGARTIAVVLSGSQDDGAAGAFEVAQAGGVVFVQEPTSAAYPGMPTATLAAVPRAAPGTPAQLAKLVADASRSLPTPEPAPSDLLRMETAIAAFDEDAHAAPERPGRPVGIACPECGGAMFELASDRLLRYRCRVGHAWSPESLLTEQVASAEAALWAAVRTLEEKAALHRRLADRGGTVAAPGHRERAAEAAASAATIRRMLQDPEGLERAASP